MNEPVQMIVMGLLPVIAFLVGRYLFPNCSRSATIELSSYSAPSTVKGSVTNATSTPDNLRAYVYANTQTPVTNMVPQNTGNYPGVTGNFTLNNVPTDPGLVPGQNCLVAVWATWNASYADGPFAVP